MAEMIKCGWSGESAAEVVRVCLKWRERGWSGKGVAEVLRVHLKWRRCG